MPRLVLINGALGSGKSTMAHALAQDVGMTLALDVDAIKHSLGRWEDDPSGSGLHARRLALAVAKDHLSAGYDVVLGQYLARTPFVEDLVALAERLDARFFEFVLDIDASTLSDRIARRMSHPDRREHGVNNRLIEPDDASTLVKAIDALRPVRPQAIWIDARGSQSTTLDRLRTALGP